MKILPKSKKRLYGVIAAVVIVAAVAGGATFLVTRSARPVHTVPKAIVADCSRPVHAELNAFIAKVPDGAIIRFPPGGCYAQTESILLNERKNLRVEGRGATFRSTAPNDNAKFVPQWYLLRSRDIELHDFTAIGNFNDPGPPNINKGSVTSNAGVAVYGTYGVLLRNLTIRNVFGDGVTLGNAAYNAVGPVEFPRDVRAENLDIDRAARHCVSTSQVTGFWLVDSKLNNCYLDGVDAEKDLLTDPLSDLHFLNNTVTNYYGIGIVVPVGGLRDAPVTGVEIRGNRFPTRAIAAVCNQPVVVAGYADQYFANVVVEDNDLLSWKSAVVLSRVLSGSVAHNRITHPREAKANDCGPEHEQDVVVLESPGVTVANNGDWVEP